MEPEKIEADPSPSPEQKLQASREIGLWERAAGCLVPEDRDKLENLIRSKHKPAQCYEQDSPANDVESTLQNAQDLKKEKEGTWRPVVDRIINAISTFKSLGDTAVAFDKSGYAALGWSVVSFGLQLAVNKEDVREFVLDSSEVITRCLAKYRRYEQYFRGQDAGEDFDLHLTNVYKAILLYTIALNEYLCQSDTERLARAVSKLEEHRIVSIKKDIDTADAEVSDWLIIILLMRNNNHFSQIQKTLQDHNPPEIAYPLQNCLKSLAFPEMYARQNDIERAAEGTCKWLLRHEKYRGWADSNHGLICIKGKPGSGKSTLVRYALGDAIVAARVRDGSLLQHSEGSLRSGEPAGAHAEPDTLTLSFFFHDRGTSLQKTRLGLYRSLLHQLLRYVPNAIPGALLTTFDDRTKKMGEPGEKWSWHWRELQDFFQLSLHKALESHQVCLFVDALDEYGEENANELIDSFNSWFQASPRQSQFRICFTSRHYPPLALPKEVAEIRLEDENKNDISAYVQAELSDWSKNAKLASMWTDITDRASGVFVWARLIVPRVLKLEREGESPRKIKNEIENTPQELDDLYRGLVKEVAVKPNSLKLISWICFAMEPLTLDELRWAMAVDPTYSSEPDSLRQCEDTDDFATDCDMMEKRLKALSCGLAEAVPSSRIVQFIHQTVKDFFISGGLSALQNLQDPACERTNEDELEAVAQYQLSRTCIRYLSADEIMLSELPSWGLKDVFPLLRYATIWWIAHAQKSEKSISQADLLVYFNWPSEAIVQLWTKVYQSIEHRVDSHRPRDGTTMLHIASRYRLMGPLVEILQSKELPDNGIDASDDENATPLWWAAREGNEAVVRLLLDNGADLNVCGKSWGYALHAASSAGNNQIILMLLECGADINARGGSRGTALHAASFCGHELTVKLLLESGADVNINAGSYGNALQAACFNGHEQIVRVLLENGADVNVRRGVWYDALSAAIPRGSKNEGIIRMLLENGANVNANTGSTHNALHRAVNDGQEQILRMLLEKGADVTAQSRYLNNWTALQMASQSRFPRFAQIFREYGAE